MSRGGHQPSRPSWRCRDDGDLWPCESACKKLGDAYRTAETALATHMAWLMAAAAEDLALADPSRLYRRFVRWAHHESIRCGRCGKQGHQILPGLPLRLFPCVLGKPR